MRELRAVRVLATVCRLHQEELDAAVKDQKEESEWQGMGMER